jgi:GGDEF domain-containing protein
MAFDPTTAKPLTFDTSSAKPAFDPSTAQPSQFDPTTAEPVEASWGDTLKALPSQIVAGAEQAAGGLMRTVGEGDYEVPGFMRGTPMGAIMALPIDAMRQRKKTHPEEFTELTEAGESVQDLGEFRMERDTPKDQTFWQKAVSTAGQSLGQSVPLAGAAFITRNPGIVAGGFGAQEFGRAYGEGRSKGLSEDKAFRYAALNGMIEAGTEFLPAKALFKNDQGFTQRFINFMARELPGENIAEISQSVNEWANGLREDLTLKDVIDTMALTSASTLIGGGGQTTAAHLLEKVSKQAPPAPEATLDDIAAAPDESVDSIVDNFLNEQELPIPDIEAFNDQINVSESVTGAQQENQALAGIQPEISAENVNGFVQDRAPLNGRRAEARGPDRRVADMTDEEKTQALLTDRLTKIPNYDAFHEHTADNPNDQVLYGDLDDFKKINTEMTHKGGDLVLQKVGEIKAQVAKELGIRPYRRSGDEFLGTGADPVTLGKYGQEVQKRLAGATVTVKLPDGSTRTHTGIGYSYGVGKDETAAEQAADTQKAERRAAGLREGIRDSDRVSEQPAAGQRDSERGRTAEPALDRSQSAGPTQVAFDPTTAELSNDQAQDNQAAQAPLLSESTDSANNLQQSGDIVPRFTKTEVSENDKQSMRLRESASAWAKELPGMPQRFYEGMAEISQDELGAAEKRQLQKLRQRISEAGEDPQTAMRAVWGEELRNASPRLRSAIERGLALSKASSGTAQAGTGSQGNAGRISQTDTRGTLDEADPNILHANPITAVYVGYQRLGRATLKRVHDAIGWKMTPLGKLPAQDLYLKDRYETLGKIADVEQISKRIYETFRGLDASEAELVYQYFTTKGADPSKLSAKPVTYTWKGMKTESTVRKQAETIKKLIDRVGNNLVEKGLLSKESYEKYQDQYLPRIYLKHLLGPDAVRGFAGGKKPSDMGYLKARKDIPQDVRELILGEITDPGYLASKSLGRSMRDLAILDWFNEIALKPDWALQEFLVDYKGTKVSIWWLKAESARIKEQTPYYKPANQAKAKVITDQLDALVARGESKLGKVTDDYRQAPDTQQYGRLRGMYLRKEIYNDLVGIPGNKDPNAAWWQMPFEYGGIGTKVTQLWKMSKVALNPPTQIRNFISNGILLQLSGVGSHRVLPLMTQAIQEIRQNGKHWRIAKKYGVTGSTFANNELYRIERALLDLKARDAGKLSMASLRNAAGIVGDFAGDMYQFSEAIWKTAKIIDAMKREGKSETEAVLDAQKWLYDYSLVPQTVRYFRNTPIGVPFLTFYYKTLPRMLEVAATAPHRFAPYVAIPALMTAYIASDYDVEPEDIEKLKMALPEWLRDHGHLFFLPYKDKHGRWQAFDFSYLLPWSMFEQLKNNLAEGQIGEAIKGAGIIGGPVPDLVSAIKTNTDSFTGKQIVDKADPPADQIKSIMNYLWSMAAPTWLTDNGFVGKMREAITHEVDKRTGEPKLTIGQAALRFMGLNMYPVEPEASRRKNISFMQFEMEDIQKRMGERLRDKNLTVEDKRDIREVFSKMLDEKKEQLKDYKEQSKIHPNLKGEKVPQQTADDNSA